MATNSSKSTTVTFAITGTDGTADAIEVELDEKANGGKSTFLPTDKAYFLVFTNPENLALSIDATMGTITALGTKSVERTDTLQFVQSASESLNNVPTGSVRTEWIGRAGGTVAVSGTSVSVPTAVNGILNCTYTATAKSYSLSGVSIPPGLEEIEVLIVVSPAA